ncbi:cytochrome P450 81E8-like protein [Tanacetum coccineum]
MKKLNEGIEKNGNRSETEKAKNEVLMASKPSVSIKYPESIHFETKCMLKGTDQGHWDNNMFGTIGEILGLSKQNGEEIKRCYINYLDVFTSYYKTARVSTRNVEEGNGVNCLTSHQSDFAEIRTPNVEAAKGKEKMEHFGIELEDTSYESDNLSPIHPSIKGRQIMSKDNQGVIKGPIKLESEVKEDCHTKTMEGSLCIHLPHNPSSFIYRHISPSSQILQPPAYRLPVYPDHRPPLPSKTPSLLTRTLWPKISAKYGPIVFLRFGSRRVLLVSSPSASEECFTKNDIIFANRPHTLFSKIIGNNYSSLASSSYGENWRNLRKIASVEILSIHRLRQVFHDIRWIRQPSCTESNWVIIPEDMRKKENFYKILDDMFLFGGAANVGDYLPILSWLGVNGLEKKLVDLAKRRKVFFQGLIEQLRKSKGVNKKKTMIELLLSLKESDPDYYTDDMIRSFVLVLLVHYSNGDSCRLVSLVSDHGGVVLAVDK